MSIRNLEYLFTPKSIAVLGSVSGGKQAPERLLLRNLVGSGFRGQIMALTGRTGSIDQVPTYTEFDELPSTPELLVITQSDASTPALIQHAGETGTRAVIFADRTDIPPDPEQRERARAQVLAIAHRYQMRILGPAGLGLIVSGHGLNASFCETVPLPGSAALITQSSGVFRAALEWATTRSLGFSHMVSLGAALEVNFGDVLDYLAGDYKARAILMYLEHVRNPRRFLSAARRAARTKPVIVYRPRAGSRHDTSDAVYEAAFRRAGLIRVQTLANLLNSVETLTLAKPPDKDRLAIVGNSRSLSLAALDMLEREGGTLAQLSAETREALVRVEPTPANLGNPVDLGDYAGADTFRETLSILAKDPQVDATLVVCAPGALGSNAQVAEVLVEMRRLFKRKLLLSCWPGSLSSSEPRRRLRAGSVPSYEDPGEAVCEFLELALHRRRQRLLAETPPSVSEQFTPNHEQARRVIDRVRADGRELLNEIEALDLLAAYRIPVVETTWARDPSAAAETARRLNRPVALKLVTPDVASKSEVGAVALGLESPEDVLREAGQMIERLRAVRADASVAGFIVQHMVPRGASFEIRAGFESGGPFGPVMYFGHGGTEAEVINDKEYGLPPLNMHLARELMSQTRIFSMLDGKMLRRADVDALALLLVKLSQLVIDLDDVEALDINPVWANADGLIALDARIRLRSAGASEIRRLAVRPYPKQLEESLELPGVGALLMRPLLPEDEPELRAFIQRCDPNDLRLRFFQPIRELSHETAARLTQLDYDREMAFALARPGQPGTSPIHAVVRMSSDPDDRRAEYAIILERILRGHGMGKRLMGRIIDYARDRGLAELYGEVLRENKPMLRLNEALGFKRSVEPEDPAIMLVTLSLRPADEPSG